MANWREILGRVGDDAEALFGRLRRQLDERLGSEQLAIVPYLGYGTPTQLVLRGRVLEATNVRDVGDNDSIWANLLNTYRRFETDEVPGARILGRFGGVEQEVTSDREGFFELRMHLSSPPPTDRAWHQVELSVLAPSQGTNPVQAVGEVFIPQPDAQFGVISDIDDTVVQTDATNLIRMARTVFLGNARTRMSFPGVAALYRALHAGAPGPFVNPIFYVSSSPWNIYDMLIDFLALQDIPKGPMFLRDWGVTRENLPFGHRTHKLAAIRETMDFFPQLPFILIGDSGQEDPEIYEEVVRLYPNRIRAIYIRNVSNDSRRVETIRALTEQVVTSGSTLILADNTVMMAQHAAAQSWIDPAVLPMVEVEKQIDEGPQSPVEQGLDETATVVTTGAPTQAGDQVAATMDAAPPEQPAPTIIVEGDTAEQRSEKEQTS